MGDSSNPLFWRNSQVQELLGVVRSQIRVMLDLFLAEGIIRTVFEACVFVLSLWRSFVLSFFCWNIHFWAILK